MINYVYINDVQLVKRSGGLGLAIKRVGATPWLVAGLYFSHSERLHLFHLDAHRLFTRPAKYIRTSSMYRMYSKST